MKEVLTLNQHEKLHRRNIDCLATLMEISGPENNNPEHPTKTRNTNNSHSKSP